jgi:methionyl-tRNA formyltransferase
VLPPHRNGSAGLGRPGGCVRAATAATSRSMRAIFMGTPEIAVPALDALVGVAEVVGVVCQPDRPAGRGLALAEPPVKRRAVSLGLDVLQPVKVKTPELAAWMAVKRPDVAVVLAYGRILPGPVLEAPARGCLNLHASILPMYRGAAPVQWAVVRGEKETGVSLMQMDAGLDTGPVFTVRRLSIGPDETAGELATRIAALAADVVRLDVPRAAVGELVATPQDAARATFAPLLCKDDGRIDWTKSASAVHDHVRGMSPWPGATTHVGGKMLKILETRASAFLNGGARPATVVAADTGGVLVACGTGLVEIMRAQLEGKKPLGGRDLANGRTLSPGMVLG